MYVNTHLTTPRSVVHDRMVRRLECVITSPSGWCSVSHFTVHTIVPCGGTSPSAGTHVRQPYNQTHTVIKKVNVIEIPYIRTVNENSDGTYQFLAASHSHVHILQEHLKL